MRLSALFSLSIGVVVRETTLALVPLVLSLLTACTSEIPRSSTEPQLPPAEDVAKLCQAQAAGSTEPLLTVDQMNSLQWRHYVSCALRSNRISLAEYRRFGGLCRAATYERQRGVGRRRTTCDCRGFTAAASTGQSIRVEDRIPFPATASPARNWRQHRNNGRKPLVSQALRNSGKCPHMRIDLPRPW
jgi:hypothetical protein